MDRQLGLYTKIETFFCSASGENKPMNVKNYRQNGLRLMPIELEHKQIDLLFFIIYNIQIVFTVSKNKTFVCSKCYYPSEFTIRPLK